MKIFIDSEYRCHTANPDGTLQEVDTDFFNGKCQTFVEGYRYIPDGESWTRSDGVVFHGEMIAPWKPYSELYKAQREYEKQKLLELQNEKEELITSYAEGVNSI